MLCQDDVASQSSSDEGSSRLCILSEDQISKWCAVILDSHYTQLILSDQAELLVKLHHIVTQQVSWRKMLYMYPWIIIALVL